MNIDNPGSTHGLFAGTDIEIPAAELWSETKLCDAPDTDFVITKVGANSFEISDI